MMTTVLLITHWRITVLLSCRYLSARAFSTLESKQAEEWNITFFDILSNKGKYFPNVWPHYLLETVILRVSKRLTVEHINSSVDSIHIVIPNCRLSSWPSSNLVSHQPHSRFSCFVVRLLQILNPDFSDCNILTMF